MSGKHKAALIDTYLEIHETTMERLRREKFVLEDTLEIVPVGARVLAIRGEIRCDGGLDIDVKKFLNVTRRDGETLVETFEYKYAAHVAGLCPIFRYCSPHGHRPYHHFHRFDVFGTGEEDPACKERHLTDDEWPTLGQAIDQLREWHHEHGHMLPELKKRRR